MAAPEAAASGQKKNRRILIDLNQNWLRTFLLRLMSGVLQADRQFNMCPSDKRFWINNFLLDTRVIIFERSKSEMARLTVSIVRQR